MAEQNLVSKDEAHRSSCTDAGSARRRARTAVTLNSLTLTVFCLTAALFREPLGNLGACQVLVDRFEETLAESERKKEEAAAAPPAAAAAGRTPRVKHKREEKVAEPEVAEVMPRSKRARKAVEKFEPIGQKRMPSRRLGAPPGALWHNHSLGCSIDAISFVDFLCPDFDTERALRQKEQLEQLMSGTKRARKQPAAAGEGKAAAAGEVEEEKEEDAEDEYEITRIIGKKKEKGVTLYLCEWAPIGEQTFEPTFEVRLLPKPHERAGVLHFASIANGLQLTFFLACAPLNWMNCSLRRTSTQRVSDLCSFAAGPQHSPSEFQTSGF